MLGIQRLVYIVIEDFVLNCMIDRGLPLNRSNIDQIIINRNRSDITYWQSSNLFCISVASILRTYKQQTI